MPVIAMTPVPLSDSLANCCVLGYIGPGAGFAFLGSFFVLFLALLLGLMSFLSWPLRLLIRMFVRFRKGLKPLVRRVVIIGLDGFDAGRTQRLMAAGKLPNLAELAEKGSFKPLITTIPPLSPVAWSSFMTGVNPGKHNIFDFLSRDLRTGVPQLSSSRVEASRAKGLFARLGRPRAVVRGFRKSKPFWHVLGEYGVFSTVLRVPITFPPERFYGLSLSGMCVPDLRGTQGSYTLFSSEISEPRETRGGVHLPVRIDGHRAEALLPGPPRGHSAGGSPVRIPLHITIRPADPSATIRVCGQTVRLSVGQYSEWVRLEFPLGVWRKARGICRFRLSSISPFRLYVTPLNIDPESPAMPVSYPSYFATYLAKLLGPFATLGLAEDTQALDEGTIDASAFLEQTYAIHSEREKMFFEALKRTRSGLCVCVFDASDRIQHTFCPRGDGEADDLQTKAVEDMYARMDKLVGDVLAQIGEQTSLFVLSDHGFCRFDRGVHLNAWLRQKGYLAVKDGAQGADYLADVDWERTQAYAFGMSGIYLNRKGRERQGGVEPGAEARALKEQIRDELLGLTDPERGGTRPILAVYDSETVYQGPYADNGPDLIVGYAAGYRVSWETVVGAVDGPALSDNSKAWSADHCVDRSLVPGVLFANRRILDDSPSITDIAPTALSLLGVPVPRYMDGKPLKVENG
jgi:predicted AlkP superfamily phosphohydrolase/phosphomutase